MAFCVPSSSRLSEMPQGPGSRPWPRREPPPRRQHVWPSHRKHLGTRHGGGQSPASQVSWLLPLPEESRCVWPGRGSAAQLLPWHLALQLSSCTQLSERPQRCGLLGCGSTCTSAGSGDRGLA